MPFSSTALIVSHGILQIPASTTVQALASLSFRYIPCKRGLQRAQQAIEKLPTEAKAIILLGFNCFTGNSIPLRAR